MILTERQQQAQAVLSGPARHLMLFGGSRSGKTALLVRNLIVRALKAPNSRHAIFRFRLNHLVASIVLDTFPKVMRMAFPDVEYDLKKQDLYCDLPNESQVWFAGLDDKERTEKVLGMEFVTEYFNECSQIPVGSIDVALTRLAQLATVDVAGMEPRPLALRAYYDCVSGDTVLDGHTKTVKELAADAVPIRVLTTHGWVDASAPWANGYGPMLLVRTSSGRQLRVTPSHRFWTPKGWTRADQLVPSAELLCIAKCRFPDDAQGVPHVNGRPQGCSESCCKCLRQHGAQPPQAAKDARASPASSFGARPRTHGGLSRDEQGSRMGRHDQPAAQHSRRIRSFRELLSLSCAALFWARECLTEAGICVWFRRRWQSRMRSAELSYLALPVEQRFAFAQLSFVTSRHGQAVAQLVGGNDTPWLRNSQRQTQWTRPRDHEQRDREWLDGWRDAIDTPCVENGWFETVDCILPQPAATFYTLEVPSCLHYAAAGLVSHNCNPPSKAHWSYRRFIQKIDPETKLAIAGPEQYDSFLINPRDNVVNLSPEYIKVLESMPARMQGRFLHGRFADANPNALFPDEYIERWRVIDGVVPDMVRVAVAVDPSGSDDTDNADNDEIGIIVAGLGTDGNAYVLEDCTVKGGPATWGRVAVTAWERHSADVVVGEINYGGAMVQQTIHVARPRTPFKKVTASRGKVVRAEPFSALYENGKVRHVGMFAKLEDELSGFSTFGYTGKGSPNRADALIWALAELFPGIVGNRLVQPKVDPIPMVSPWGRR